MLNQSRDRCGSAARSRIWTRRRGSGGSGDSRGGQRAVSSPKRHHRLGVNLLFWRDKARDTDYELAFLAVYKPEGSQPVAHPYRRHTE